jgi:hypothetical protein
MRVRRRWLATRAAIAAIAANVIRQASLLGMTVLMVPCEQARGSQKDSENGCHKIIPQPPHKRHISGKALRAHRSLSEGEIKCVLKSA